MKTINDIYPVKSLEQGKGLLLLIKRPYRIVDLFFQETDRMEAQLPRDLLYFSDGMNMIADGDRLVIVSECSLAALNQGIGVVIGDQDFASGLQHTAPFCEGCPDRVDMRHGQGRKDKVTTLIGKAPQAVIGQELRFGLRVFLS